MGLAALSSVLNDHIFGWLVLHQRELRGFGLHSEAPVQLVPLRTIVPLLAKLLLLFLLGRNCEFFELIPVHLHVGANDLVCDCGHSLVPVLLLRPMQQALHHDGVSPVHASLHELLNYFRVEEQQRTLGCLVVHPLACAE